MARLAVTAELVGPQSRHIVLPRHFGIELMLAVERAVVRTLEDLSADYRSGYWHFYELSNGGFYMAPDLQPLRIHVADNEFCELVSADAAGIVACLFVYGRLSSAYRSNVLVEHYHWLRDFTHSHPEAMQILRAID